MHNSVSLPKVETRRRVHPTVAFDLTLRAGLEKIHAAEIFMLRMEAISPCALARAHSNKR